MSITLLRSIRWIAFVLIFVLAGFYASLWFRTQQATNPLVGMAVPEDGQIVTQLPEFSLADMNGNLRSISEFTGGPLLINFWATWCGPCIREMPLLESVWQARRGEDGLQVVGIAVDRTAEVSTYLETTPVTYPILIGQSDGMSAAESFGPAFVGLPFTVFVAPDGQILTTYSGELTDALLENILSIVDQVAAKNLSTAAARQLLKTSLKD